MSGPHVKTITINDFQGFPPKQAVPPITLGGKNLLLYGENGSGKSTIFTALAELLNRHPTRAFDTHTEKASCLKHRFSDKELSEGKVALAFTAGQPMEWLISRPRAEHEKHSYFNSMSRSSGFLDYRAILRTHFLDYQNESINLFSLVVETLLRDVEMRIEDPSATTTFGEEWDTIIDLRGAWLEIFEVPKHRLNPLDENYLTPQEMDDFGFEPLLYPGENEDGADDDSGGEAPEINIAEAFVRFREVRRQDLAKKIDSFSVVLRQRLSEIVTLANKYLSRFDPVLALSFDRNAPFIPTDEDNLRENDWKDKAHLPYRAVFRGELINHPGTLLNEARLTAIALTFYLAALKRQTPKSTPITAPRLLVLDDVLIGLDMAHRRPVLNLLKNEFSQNNGWQTILLTYDREWYEVAKQHLATEDWQYYEMYAVRVGDYEQPLTKPVGGYEQPLIKLDSDHLYRALGFLDAGEVKAAAVHVRSKFELVVKDACAEFGVPIRYNDNMQKTAISEFWKALKSHGWERKQPAVSGISKGEPYTQPEKIIHVRIITKSLGARIDQAVSWVLNPLSHSQTIASYRCEIEDAVFAVDILQTRISEISNRELVLERCSLIAMLNNILEVRQRTENPAEPSAP